MDGIAKTNNGSTEVGIYDEGREKRGVEEAEKRKNERKKKWMEASLAPSLYRSFCAGWLLGWFGIVM